MLVSQPRTTTATITTKPHSEETQSYSQQRVNGGTVVETRNMRQTEPLYDEIKPVTCVDRVRKASIVNLANAIKDISSAPRAPPSQKVKESKLLLDLERQQKTYGTIQQSDVQPNEPNLPKPSTLTQIKKGQGIYTED